MGTNEQGQARTDTDQDGINVHELMVEGMPAVVRAIRELAGRVRALKRRLNEVEYLLSEEIGQRLTAASPMVCSLCGHEVDDADYWSGDRCLRSAP